VALPSDEEGALLRALADPDPTVQRMAAVRAHRLPLPSGTRVLAALETLLAHEDKYLRRAAASSYVAMHPRGPGAPALRLLREDPADVVVLTARGALLDRGHEMAELAFVVRTLAHATRPDADSTAFSTTVARWHRFLWNYSPNPRAQTATNTVTTDELDRDAARLRHAVAIMPHDRPVPHDVTMLQLRLHADTLVARGFVHGHPAWTAALPIKLPALHRLADLAWEVDDAPWPAMFAAGAFALAVAAAIAAATTAWLGAAGERELATSIGDGEQIFLGFLRPTGVAFTE
jgi:hypothetical protein